MRMLLLVIWLLAPISVGIWHYGPGQEHVLRDEVALILDKADSAATSQQWAQAASLYDDALKRLPTDMLEAGRRIRLERAKARMNSEQLPAAHEDLKILVDELASSPSTDPKLLADARAALASAQYYMTWLMRLEGQPRELWEPEVESARQIYRLLQADAASCGDTQGAKKCGEDLEASIRLARMDLSELQGLPLPSQCKGCKSCNGQGRSPKSGKGAKAGDKKKDARGASSGPPPDEAGH